MNLKQIKQQVALPHAKTKRRGRGRASGLGKTGGHGNKGQRARSGTPRRRLYEGGQMPMVRVMPKRGFNNTNFRRVWAIVNLDILNRFDEGTHVTPGLLLKEGVISRLEDGLKILGRGELTRKLKVSAHQFSASALDKIKAAQGEAERLS